MTESKQNYLKLKRRFTLMQFLLWFTFGTFGMFYVAYLRDLGYSSRLIALGLTISTITGIGAQYFWGYISDMTSAIKTIFLCLLVGMATVVLMFPLVAKGPFFMILLIVLFRLAWMPLEALLDSWILSIDEIPNEEYGSIRSGGSFGFAMITVFFGSLIVKVGFGISIAAFTVSAAMLFIVALTTKGHTSKRPTHMGLKQIRALLSNRRYVMVLIFSVLIFVNHMGINSYYIYVVQQVGGDEALVGQAAAVAAFIEIPGFYLGAKLLKRFNPLLIMVAVAIGFLLRVYLLMGTTSYIIVLVTAAIQGLVFSFFMGTFKVYISNITPLSLLATAQTVAASTYFGIASIIANIFAGILIDDYGMTAYYQALITVSVIAIAFSLIMYVTQGRRGEEVEEV